MVRTPPDPYANPDWRKNMVVADVVVIKEKEDDVEPSVRKRPRTAVLLSTLKQ